MIKKYQKIICCTAILALSDTFATKLSILSGANWLSDYATAHLAEQLLAERGEQLLKQPANQPMQQLPTLQFYVNEHVNEVNELFECAFAADQRVHVREVIGSQEALGAVIDGKLKSGATIMPIMLNDETYDFENFNHCVSLVIFKNSARNQTIIAYIDPKGKPMPPWMLQQLTSHSAILHIETMVNENEPWQLPQKEKSYVLSIINFIQGMLPALEDDPLLNSDDFLTDNYWVNNIARIDYMFDVLSEQWVQAPPRQLGNLQIQYTEMALEMPHYDEVELPVEEAFYGRPDDDNDEDNPMLK